MGNLPAKLPKYGKGCIPFSGYITASRLTSPYRPLPVFTSLLPTYYQRFYQRLYRVIVIASTIYLLIATNTLFSFKTKCLLSTVVKTLVPTLTSKWLGIGATTFSARGIILSNLTGFFKNIVT